MRSRIFQETAKKMQTTAGRWVQILPDEGDGYRILDLSNERPGGRLLVDEQSFWIYDGSTLSLEEQDEVAGQIVGYQHEMDELLKTISFGARS